MPRRRRYYPECIPALIAAGISERDAFTIRRIAMTLHRWHELECGDGCGCIERDEVTGKPYWLNSYTMRRSPIADRETGAITRLKALMSAYPALGYYIQGDPRGCALFILRPGDIPGGCDPDAYYSRGVAVYK